MLLCLIVYLPGLTSIPPVDRDECRFAQASRQMFESATLPAERQDVRTDAQGRPLGPHAGGWVVPMVQDRPRLNKPPLVYWLHVASAWAFTAGDPARDAMWMYRIPSILCAIMAVLATWRIGLRMFDPRAAWLAGGLLGLSPMVVWDAHQARADQLLLACTTLAMLALWRCIKAPGSWGWPIALWACVGLGILAKGFITPMVVVLGLGAFCACTRSLAPVRAVRAWLALPVLLLIVSPWLVLIDRHFGLWAYASIVWEETFRRGALGSREGHFAPPGTHLLLLVVLFWPGCFATAEGFVLAVRRAWGGPKIDRTQALWPRFKQGLARVLRTRAQGRAAELFLLSWIVPAWIVFELSPAKLPHYTLPMYPAIALLSARAVLSARLQRPLPALDAGLFIWTLIPATLALGLIGVLLIPGWTNNAVPTGWPAVLVALGAVVALVLLALAHRRFRSGHAAHGQLLGLAVGICLLVPTLQVVAPALVPGRASARIIERLHQIDPSATRPLASTYHEDSIIFHSRGQVQRIASTDLLTWLNANPQGLAIVRLKSIPDALAEEKVLVRDQASGLGIVGGPVP